MKIIVALLLLALTLPLAGCYQLGYGVGTVVHTILPTPPENDRN